MTTEKALEQCSLSENYKFASRCTHCGNPMGYMTIDRLTSDERGGFKRDEVFTVWIDPSHECSYLKIERKETEISA